MAESTNTNETYQPMTFDAIKIGLASPEKIREWSRGDIRNLAVNGKDLIAIGVTQGKQIGEILNILLEDVLEEPSHNTKEYLLELAKNKIGQEA